MVLRTVGSAPSDPLSTARLGGGEGGVEPALIADLHRHAGARDGLGDPGALGGRRRDRLLAEGGQAALDRGQRQRRVRGGGGGDDDAVDARGRAVPRPNRPAWHRIWRRPASDDVGSLVGDHQTVEPGQVHQGFGVEGADAAESDQSEGGHGILRSSWPRSAASSCSGVVVGQGGQHGVDLARRGQAADRLVAVEVGGERVALGGGDHRVEQPRAQAGLRPSSRAAPGTPPAPSRCGPAIPSPARTVTTPAAGWPSAGCRPTCWRRHRGTARG